MAENNGNEFDGLTEDIPAQEFADEAPIQPGQKEEKEVMPGDIGGATFIKSPGVGESIVLDVEKVVNNPNTTGKNKTTGDTFVSGVKKKDGTVIRYDIVTPEGRFTVSNWEIFFKLFGQDGLLTKYGNEHESFKGCKIKITKNFNARYANMPTADVAAIIKKTPEEAEKFKNDIAEAMKNKKLYTVEQV